MPEARCTNCGKLLTSANWCGFCGTPQPEQIDTGYPAMPAPGENVPQVPGPENGYVYGRYGDGEWTDAKHLMWLHDRLVRQHRENPLYDYMWRLRDIIGRLRLDEQEGCEIEPRR